LLLGKAADLVIERVVNRDLATDLDRQPPSLGEIRIPAGQPGIAAAFDRFLSYLEMRLS
jgi:hypothetical protein